MDYTKLLKYSFFISIFDFIITLVTLNKTFIESIPIIIVLLISIIFSYKLYLLSNDDINYINKNRKLVLVISIYLLFTNFISGILGVIFLFKTKQKNIIPKIENIYDFKDKVISLLFILFFIIVFFIFSKVNLFVKVPKAIIYVLFFTLNILVNYNTLKYHLLVFLKNKKTYLLFIIKNYFKMYFVFLLVSIVISFITKDNISKNQMILNEEFKKAPLLIFMLTCFYAPLVEEGIFRLCFSKLINKKWLFIFLSGFIFGVLHVIDNITSYYDLLFIVQYTTLGIFLAKAYYDSKNIMVSISMHFMQNFIASILIILLNFFK